MSQFYAFNGDADGLCALHQLRLTDPTTAELVTGVKRDIKLLDRIEVGAGDKVIALDISLDSNRQGLMRLLKAGANVEYFDHHYAGEIPQHRNLMTCINLSAEVCTSILVDRHLEGRYHLWAIVAAFGDNLKKSAYTFANSTGLTEPQTEKLKCLGEYLNYNSYGDSLQDLHFHPAALYEEIRPYSDPFDFISESVAFTQLAAGFCDDMGLVDSLQPLQKNTRCATYLLPNTPWARRVSGIFANRLANDNPTHAHAVITPNQYKDYTVSVRAPIMNPQGADMLCLQFETGGGRKAAAGINRLPTDLLDYFMASFMKQFSQVS